ncbi:MAG: hypothetical protein AB7U73_02020 [Pirellulales bacterium]
MRIAHASLRSVSPYSQSKFVPPNLKGEKENSDDFEKRIWRERLHVNAIGEVFIPPMAFKNCLATAAKYLGIQIPGKGKSQYTKHFLSGVLVVEGLPLPLSKDDVPGEWLHLDANGQKNSGKRVMRCYPRIDNWSGTVDYVVLDDVITEEVFGRVLVESGRFIGIGRFSPFRGGYYGRFAVEGVKWDKAE